MAARRLIAIHFLRKESSIVATNNIRYGGGYQLLQRSPQIAATTTHQLSLKSFSSSQINDKLISKKKKKVDNNKKSPHSKLLRVCSERNSNAHFAAIEGTYVVVCGYHIL